jgi:putative N6-adenine-specific DNA methylase
MTGVAPLNEVLAAGILNFSGWDLKRPLMDPMCGSGTFLCEALMLARNIPPTIKRKSFGFMNHKDYDHSLWGKLKAKSLEGINDNQPIIMGFDNFNEMIIASRTNINNILPNNNCKITFKDFFDLEPPIENPLMILNPPYNVRIAQEKNHLFYEKIGSRLKHTWSGSDAWILSGDLESLKHIGLRPIRRIKLFNGPIETKLVHIPLYKGSKKDKYR